jgi:hypothetical protein
VPQTAYISVNARTPSIRYSRDDFFSILQGRERILALEPRAGSLVTTRTHARLCERRANQKMNPPGSASEGNRAGPQ